jgi:hypothetical protein
VPGILKGAFSVAKNGTRVAGTVSQHKKVQAVYWPPTVGRMLTWLLVGTAERINSVAGRRDAVADAPVPGPLKARVIVPLQLVPAKVGNTEFTAPLATVATKVGDAVQLPPLAVTAGALT